VAPVDRSSPAVNATTGDVVTAFHPRANGTVREVVVSPDGETVYAGGVSSSWAARIAGETPVRSTPPTGTATSFAPRVENGSGVVTVALSQDGGA
jgi:hypothetical protein